MLPSMHRAKLPLDTELPSIGIASKHMRSPSVSLLPGSPLSTGSDSGASPARPPRSTRRSSGFGFKPLDLEALDKTSSSGGSSSPSGSRDSFFLPIVDVNSDAVLTILMSLRSTLLTVSSRSPLQTPPFDSCDGFAAGCDTARSVATQPSGHSTLPSIGRHSPGASLPSGPLATALPFLPTKVSGVEQPQPQSPEISRKPPESDADKSPTPFVLDPAPPATSRRGSSVRTVLSSVTVMDPFAESSGTDNITRSMLALEILQTLLEKYGECDVRTALLAAYKDRGRECTNSSSSPSGIPALLPDNAMVIVTNARSSLNGLVKDSKPEELPGADSTLNGKKPSRFARRPSMGA